MSSEERSERFYRPAGAPIARTAPSPHRCPTCKQPLGTQMQQLKQGRVCVRCERPINRHEKFTIAVDGLRHRNCEDPESYM